MDITVIKVDYQRNGVCGKGFGTVLFDWTEDGVTRRMVANLHSENDFTENAPNPYISVWAVKDLAEGNLSNHWRGDHFDHQVREAIRQYFDSL